MNRDDAFSGRYSGIYDLFHEAKPYASEVEFVLERCFEHLGRRPESIVDLACGTGKHLLEFANRGLTVHGNDISAGMLAEAQRRLHAGGAKNFSLSRSPMQNLTLKSPAPEHVDLATAFYTAMGYLVVPQDLDALMRNLRNILKPGGLFFADLWNGHKMASQFSPNREKIAENESIQVRRTSDVSSEARQNALRVRFSFDLLTKATGIREAFSEEHCVRYHTVPEVENILLAHGFSILEHGPYFDEATTTESSWNFYLLAQKHD
jgi:SAM-dependent methyltransferase